MDITKLTPYQQRVIVERNELQVKFHALAKFLTDGRADVIDPQERALLSIQYSAMNAYLQILDLRVVRFK